MTVIVNNLYQSIIEFDGVKMHAVGPLTLLNRLQELKNTQGSDPKQWVLAKPLKCADEVLIQELIAKLNNEPVLPYAHEELCHCRMVSAEKVHQAIKQGARSVQDIARTTLAGTGCGSCRPDIENILKNS